MSEMSEMDKLLAGLKASEPGCRDVAASALGDLLEADFLQGREFKRAVRALIDAALTETDPVVKESVFNALSTASASPEAGQLSWDVIASSLEDLDTDCLEHALVILGFLRDPRYRAQVERYLTHPSETIRSTALDALALLESPPKRNSSHKKKVI